MEVKYRVTDVQCVLVRRRQKTALSHHHLLPLDQPSSKHMTWKDIKGKNDLLAKDTLFFKLFLICINVFLKKI